VKSKKPKPTQAKKMKKCLTRGVEVQVRTEAGDNPLSAAVQSGNLAALQFLLDHGADLKSHAGTQALLEACWKERSDMVNMLLDRGANINSDYEDDSPMTAALESSNGPLAQELIARGAEVNARGWGGWTPLMLAASSGDAETLKLLLDYKADVDMLEAAGKSVLHFSHTYPGITRLLLEHGAATEVRANCNDATPLIECAQFGDTDALGHLIEFGADVNAKEDDNATALMYAAERGDMKAVELLLNAGAEVNVVGRSVEMCITNVEARPALMWAVSSRHLEVARTLLEAGADVNAVTDYGYTALILATWTEEARLVELLLEFGADVSMRDLEARTAADYAARMERWDLVHLIEERENNGAVAKLCDELVKASALGKKRKMRALLKKGVSIECRGGWGHTPLLAACKCSRCKEVVKMLVEAGANLEARHFTGSTPLIEACGNGDMDIIEYLVGAGADLEGRGTEGNIPLIESLRSGKPEVVELLLRLGAFVDNWNDQDGTTTLMQACWLGLDEIVRVLLKATASINAISHNKRSPLMFAVQGGHANIVCLLLREGADRYLRDQDGRTVLTIAAEIGDPEMVELLNHTTRS
jgi:ankyrin repeat protein